MGISKKLMSAAGAGDKTYLVAANRKASPNGGIGVFDITNPTNITHEGNFAQSLLNEPEKLGYSEGSNFLVVGGVSGNRIATFDMSDPTNAVAAGGFDFTVLGLTMAPSGNHVYAGRQSSGGIYAFSISASGALSFFTAYSPTGGFDFATTGFVFAYDAARDDIFGGGDLTYDRAAALNVVTPTSFSLVSNFNNVAYNNVIRAKHDDAEKILFTLIDESPYRFAATNTTNPSSLSVLSSVDVGTGVMDFDIDPVNKKAYVLTNTALRSVNYSTPSSISVLQTLTVGSSNRGISYHDGYVFITEAGGTVRAVDVSNPSSMVLADTLSGLSGDYYQSAIVVR